MSITTRAEQTITRTTSRRTENTGFICWRCGFDVPALVGGSFRNHCPQCLWSQHVDEQPGDRAAACGEPMEPIAVEPSRKGWRVRHRCRSCGHVSVNRAALDDPCPDDATVLGMLSAHA